MRFLGNGIGHKDQTVASPDEAGYEARPENDPSNTIRVAHTAQNVQPRLTVVADDTENGDEDSYAEDADADYDTDDEENVYGHF